VRTALSLVLALIAGATPAVAREGSAADSVLSFDRVQITLGNLNKLHADRALVVGDTVILQDLEPLRVRAPIRPRSAESARSLRMDDVARLEVGRSQASTGAIVGACAGVGVFAVLLSQAAYGLPWYVFPFGGLFAMAGAGVGAVTGSAFHHWEMVYDAERGWRGEARTKYAADEGGVGYRGTRTEE